MIPAQQVIETVLAVATVDETIALVTDRVEASLRWANSAITGNGVSTSRSTTVISIVRRGDRTHVGSVQTDGVDLAQLGEVVAASEHAARAVPAAQDGAQLIGSRDAPHDWDHAVAAAEADALDVLAAAIAPALRGPDQVFGFARYELATTFLATSTGLRRRFTQPTGSVRMNAKRDGASAWVAADLPDPNEVPVERMLADLSMRLGWARRTVSLPAGRYPTLLPPSTVADLMVRAAWAMDGRAAQQGRSAFSAVGGGTRVGERLAQLPITMYSDPAAHPVRCRPFVAATTSSASVSVFDNGMDIARVDWLRDGVINALAYPRAAAAEYGVPVAVAGDNLVMPGGADSLDDMIAGSEHALLLTSLWYLRTVEPSTLLTTGPTRDGVYLVERGRVSAAVNNFRFNESPVDLLARATAVGTSEVTFPREWRSDSMRAVMPTLLQ